MKRTTLYLWIIALVAGLALPAGGSASAAGTPAFKVVASTTSLMPGGEVTVKVVAGGLPETSAYELRLAVRPSDGGTGSLTLKSQRNLLPGAGFSAHEKTGDTLTFAYALQGGQAPVSGDAELAIFTFQGTRVGKTRISLEAVKLLDASLAAATFEGDSSVLIGVSDGSGPSSPTPVPTSTTGPTAGPTDGPLPSATPTPTPGSSAGPGASASHRPTPTPVVIELAAEPNAAGDAIVQPTADQLQAALASASGGTLRIAIHGSGTVGAAALGMAAVDLPLAALRSSDLPASIEIDAGQAKIAFDPARLLALAGDSASSLRIGVGHADVSKLPEAVAAQIGDRPIYDFILTADGKRLESFGAGRPVTVSVPYAPKSGEAPERLVACFVGTDGRLEVVRHGAYDAAAGLIAFRPAHFSMYAIVEAPVAFADLSRVPWAQAGIEALAARGIASGVGEGKFAPDRHVTRAEFVALLMNVLGASSTESASAPAFADVRSDAWYAEAVLAAAKLGIALGRPDGSFGARDEISRQDIAVLMERAIRLAGGGIEGLASAIASPVVSPPASPIADRAAIAPYARDAVDALYAAGILTGVGGGRIAPAETATRAEAAVMLYRLYLQQL